MSFSSPWEPECLNYASVAIYEGAEDFIEKVKKLLTLRDDPDYLQTMDAEARANTWEARADQILNALNGNETE